VNAPPSKARDDMISLMNIWCGNVNMECAYALYHLFESNGALTKELSTMSAEKRDCIAKCDGAMWDNGKEMVETCGTLIHTVSLSIILIVTLVQF